MARSSWADARGTSSAVASCPVIRGLQKVSIDNAEEKLHPLLRDYHLSLPIDLSPLTGDHIDGYPRLKPLDFLDYMAKTGHLNKLLGGRSIATSAETLREFWNNFEKCYPDFGLFCIPEYQCIDRGDCIPIVCHCDGGRGYKKQEFLVFNWSPLIGSGSGRKNLKDPNIRALKRNSMQVNLLGHSFGSHYLWGVMPWSWQKNSDAFDEMMAAFGRDLRECLTKGITLSGGRCIRLVNIGLKADLKFQAKAGNLKRWYSTCRKGPVDPNRPSSTTGQCCWLCPAGDLCYPFEEIHTENPHWFSVMADFRDVPPWQDLPSIIRESPPYTMQLARFLLPDLFHIYLAGFGQDYAASAIVCMMGPIFGGGSVEVQLDSLNSSWKLWKKMNHVTTHTYKFTRNLLNFLDYTKTFPTGTWSKASDTAKIIKFIKDICELYPEQVSNHRTLYYVDISARTLGKCMKSLYGANLWIEPRFVHKHFFLEGWAP